MKNPWRSIIVTMVSSLIAGMLLGWILFHGKHGDNSLPLRIYHSLGPTICVLIFLLLLMQAWKLGANILHNSYLLSESGQKTASIPAWEAAQTMLKEKNASVPIFKHATRNSFDATEKSIFLSEKIYDSYHEAALIISCHEAGHAIEDAILSLRRRYQVFSILFASAILVCWYYDSPIGNMVPLFFVTIFIVLRFSNEVYASIIATKWLTSKKLVTNNPWKLLWPALQTYIADFLQIIIFLILIDQKESLDLQMRIWIFIKDITTHLLTR